MAQASKTMVLPATKREIPRPFAFEWGKGRVVEEASVKCQLNNHSWEPTIQLLQYEDGSETLRFCVFHGKRFSRMPLIASPHEFHALMQEVAKQPRIREIFSKSSPRTTT